MNIIKFIFFTTTLFSAIPQTVLAQEIDEVDTTSILEKVDAIRSPSENFVFTVKVDSQTSTLKNESEFEVLVHNRTKSLVLYRQPIKQRGRALLLDGPNMWIYIPGTNRPVRISPQQQLTGAVSNADVARVVFSLDYRVERIEKQRIDDLPAFKLELRARQSNIPYQYVQLWITQKDLHPLKADFFSLSQKLIRTIHYEGYKNILGQQRPTTLKISDAINPSVKATLTYSNFKIQDTPPEYYQPSYLERLAN
ncbi:outer membrane lipoprotein-sorting protein [Herbaspirillum sp.]|uniref:outer membrane lipoprotein-sorting protein n=1 Tax=Herbaspirillum sp. TaxID=1890675 RepID=UPI001B11AF32|nr:outer membrane lipoprotein-sorting protein [Herbaspirillum sp.]MBO9537885.1 outer membrane lipoprotein-sorting protein [Herbaspirillum sp.]